MRRGSRGRPFIWVTLAAATACAADFKLSWRADTPDLPVAGTVCDNGSVVVYGHERLTIRAADGRLVFNGRVREIDAVSCLANGDLLMARPGEISIERASASQPPVVLRRMPSTMAAMAMAAIGETGAVVAGHLEGTGLPLHLVDLVTGRVESFGEGSIHPQMWDAGTAAGTVLVDAATRHIIFLPRLVPEFQVYDRRGHGIGVKPLERGPYEPAAWQDSPKRIEGAAFLRDGQTMLLQVRFDRRQAAVASCAEFDAQFRRVSEYEGCPPGRLMGSDGRREVVFLGAGSIQAFHVEGETPTRKAPRQEEPQLRSIAR